MDTKLASAFLRRMLSDPMLKKRQSVSLLTDIGRKQYRLTRMELKAAKKELGVISENIGGVQYWSLPEDEG